MPKQIIVEGLHPKYSATHCNMVLKAPKILNMTTELSMIEKNDRVNVKILIKTSLIEFLFDFGDPVEVLSLQRVSGSSCNGWTSDVE